MKAPFPYFGGKSRVAHVVWERFGDVRSYVEPFAGSLAVLLHQKSPLAHEIVNDADGLLVNFWRACKHDFNNLAKIAECPPSEIELTARHNWVVNRKDKILEMQSDPFFFDVHVAAFWLYAKCWLVGGRGFMKGTIGSRRPDLSWMGCFREKNQNIQNELKSVSDRLRGVHIFCGDWERVLSNAVLVRSSPTGVFFDPPYSLEANRTMDCYTIDSGTVAHDVRAWCLSHGSDGNLRIALAGYDGEHNELESHGWSCFSWSTAGNMAHIGDSVGKANAKRERIWFSPHCLGENQRRLF